MTCLTAVPSPQFCAAPGGESYFLEPGAGGTSSREPLSAVTWVWVGNARAVEYMEVYGGRHAVPGRAIDCTLGGLTHDIDTATEFIVFMTTYGGMVPR